MNNDYKELIDGCLRKNSSAQRDLYNLFAPKMLAVCRRYVTSLEVAKDLMQDGFITLFDKLSTYKGNGSFEGWVRRIFVNTALMYLRKNDALKFSDEIGEVDISNLVKNDTLNNLQAEDLMRLINSMPDGFRTIFNLYVIEGFDHAEISKMLKISEGTSRSQLSRGRAWLLERMKNGERYE